MHKQNSFIFSVFSLIILIIISSACRSEENSVLTRSQNYEDLVVIFQEFREFQKPKVMDGIPDYTATAMSLHWRKPWNSPLLAYRLASCLKTALRYVGWHMGMVVDKAQFMKLIRDRAKQLGDAFNLRQFMDEYLAAGMIPMSLIRWEMTGFEDEIKKLW